MVDDINLRETLAPEGDGVRSHTKMGHLTMSTANGSQRIKTIAIGKDKTNGIVRDTTKTIEGSE